LRPSSERVNGTTDKKSKMDQGQKREKGCGGRRKTVVRFKHDPPPGNSVLRRKAGKVGGSLTLEHLLSKKRKKKKGKGRRVKKRLFINGNTGGTPET